MSSEYSTFSGVGKLKGVVFSSKNPSSTGNARGIFNFAGLPDRARAVISGKSVEGAARPPVNDEVLRRRYRDLVDEGRLGGGLAGGVIGADAGANDWTRGRRPNPFFDPDWYRRQHRLSDGADPLFHHVVNQTMPAPFFCAKSYLRENADAGSECEAFAHFLQVGRREGRSLGIDGAAVATLRALHADYDWSEIDASGLLPPVPAEVLPVAGSAGSLLPEHTVKVNPLIVADFRQRASSARLISFDVWDTLLRRSTHPDEVKLHAAGVLLRELRRLERLQPISAAGLFRLRQLAEWRVADEHYEYRYADVLAEWIALSGIVDPADAARVSARLHRAELDFELRVTRVDPSGVAMLESLPEIPKVAISDFYLSGNDLCWILKHHGLLGHFRNVYVSSDFMKNKRHGALFSHVMDCERITPADILHVGDNPHADGAVPASMKIDTLLYTDHVEERRKAHFTKRFAAQLGGCGSTMLDDFVSDKHEPMQPQSSADELKNAAAIVAPRHVSSVQMLALGFLGFGLHVLEQATAAGVDRIFFATREGVFFKRICDLLINADILSEGSYPETALVEVSRRATFAPSLRDMSIPEMMRMWSQYSTQSMAAMAKSLNLDEAELAAFCEPHGLPVDEEIQYPWLDPRVLALFADLDFCQWGNAALLLQKQEISTYLEQIGFQPAVNCRRFMVDIGWRGTIQDNLARIVRGQIHGTYLALYPFLTEQPHNVKKFGFLTNHNEDSTPYELRNWAALEFISNSAGGTVSGYSQGKAVRDVSDEEEAFLHQCVEPFQDRIIEEIGSIVAEQAVSTYTLDSWRMIARDAFRAYIEKPDPEIAQMFQALMHNETFGAGHVQRMSFAIEDIGATSPAELHAGVTGILKATPWPEAWVRAGGTATEIAALPLDYQLALPRHGNLLHATPSVSSVGNRVAIFAPAPIWGSGGHRTIYNLAKALDQAGYSVDLFSERRGDYEYKEQELSGSGVRLHEEWFSGASADAAFGTICYSSKYLVDSLPEKMNKFYFVQDLEAVFNPVSDAFISAENSFALGLNHICVGRWLPHMIASQYGRGAASGGLGVDQAIYHQITNRELLERFPRRNQIAVLYQPEKWRRSPELCLNALNIVKRVRPDVEVCFYGSHARPDVAWAFSHLGLVNDLHQLNVLYNTAKVGLCVSLSNPSRVPFEMMASGCVPVDVYRYNNLFDYTDDSALLAYQTPESLAAAMLHLLADDDDWAARSQRCITLGKSRSMAWEMDCAVNAMAYCLGGGTLDDLPVPELSYAALPFLAPVDDTPSVAAWCRAQHALASLRGVG